ncbi:hypothetical protein GGR54DRAFT_533846 [Hypoxylon sp. NC1633]|nr:hypothetical protein GGR54DRAFT_533846 [Hypoxylon sp. NC1633]
MARQVVGSLLLRQLMTAGFPAWVIHGCCCVSRTAYVRYQVAPCHLFPRARIGAPRRRECARSGGNNMSLHNLCAPKRAPRFSLLLLAKLLRAMDELCCIWCRLPTTRMFPSKARRLSERDPRDADIL